MQKHNCNTPTMHIVIVNFNGLAWNAACIHSLLMQDCILLTIIVVDNASTDGSITALQQEFGNRLCYILLSENRLFAAGCNIGIQRALEGNADTILLLNNDTVTEAECLQKLHTVLWANNDTAGVQPLLTRMDAPDIVASAGCIVPHTGFAWDKDAGERADAQPEQAYAVPGITGGAALWKAEVLHKIGLFDEDFGMYFEDVDLSLRARKAGWNLLTVPSARVRHMVSASTANAPSGFCRRYCQTNALRLIAKHWPDRWWLIDSFLWLAISLLALASALCRRNGLAASIGKGILQGLKDVAPTLWRRIGTVSPENDALRVWITRRRLWGKR